MKETVMMYGIFSTQCENRSSQIQVVDFYHTYSPVAHADSFRINIVIEAMHRLTSRILGISYYFQNKNNPIHKRVCVSPPPYYVDWFEKYYPNVTLNWDNGPFLFNKWVESRGKKHPDNNGIGSLVQWLQ